MNEFYTNPYYDTDYASLASGFIPDQNVQQYPYYGPYAPQYQSPEMMISDDEDTGEEVRSTAQQQLTEYLQQKRQQEQQLALNNYYTISTGDTLSKIAAAHGMTYLELARLNGIKNANMIRTGQRLRFNDDIDNIYKDYGGIRRMPVWQIVRKSKRTSNQVHINANKQYVNLLDNVVSYAKKVPKNSTKTNRVDKYQNENTKYSSTYYPYKYTEYTPFLFSGTKSSPKRQSVSNKYNTQLISPVKSTRDAAVNIGRKISNQNADRRYLMYIYDISHNRIPKTTSFANYLKGLY